MGSSVIKVDIEVGDNALMSAKRIFSLVNTESSLGAYSSAEQVIVTGGTYFRFDNWGFKTASDGMSNILVYNHGAADQESSPTLKLTDSYFSLRNVVSSASTESAHDDSTIKVPAGQFVLLGRCENFINFDVHNLGASGTYNMVSVYAWGTPETA